MKGKSYLRFLGLASVIFCFTIFSGCGGGDEAAPDLTTTEKLRLRLDPQASNYMIMSEQAFLNGNYNMAFAFTDSAEAIVPELADIPFMRGRIHKKLNLIPSSSREYLQVINLDPEYKGVRYNLGVNAVQNGLLRESIQFFHEEARINPLPIVFLEMGKAYARLGEPDSARIAYEKAIEGDPENASAYMWYGQLLEEMGDLDKALEYSHKGLEINSGNSNYEYIIGTQYLRKGDNVKAIEYLQPVAQRLPWHQGAQYNLGQALMRLDRAEEAQKYLTQADAAQQKQQALNEAQDAINTNPDDRDNWIHRANLLWEVGQREEAIEAYRVAINIDPLNLAMQVNLASMLIENEEYESGIELLKNVLRLKLDFVGAWINLGAVLADQKQYDDARDAWENALIHDPGNAQAKAFLKQLDVIEKEAAE